MIRVNNIKINLYQILTGVAVFWAAVCLPGAEASDFEFYRAQKYNQALEDIKYWEEQDKKNDPKCLDEVIDESKQYVNDIKSSKVSEDMPDPSEDMDEYQEEANEGVQPKQAQVQPKPQSMPEKRQPLLEANLYESRVGSEDPKMQQQVSVRQQKERTEPKLELKPELMVEPQQEYPQMASQKSETVPDKDDIRKQTIDEIREGFDIDNAYSEAKSAENIREQYKAPQEEDNVQVLTPADIIRSVLKSEVQKKKIDLDFDELPLGNVLLTLAETAGINIVIDPAIKNNSLELHLKDVTIEEGLLLISQSYDLGFDKVGDSLYVTLNDKLKEKRLTSKIIKLKNINVSEAISLIEETVESVNSSEALNSIVIFGEPEQIIKAESILTRIDRPQPQVLLEAKIIELNKDAIRELGVDWSDEVRFQFQEEKRPQDFDDIETTPDSAVKVFQLARNALQFETVIKMLESQNKAKVLSNPRVTTLNNQKAEIFVGDEIPYTVTNVTGGVVTTDVRFVEPGIRLNITPSIIDEDFVVIKIEPEVSFIFAFRGPNDEFPHVKTREATAYVRVKNNEPFVIGGLLNQEDKKNLWKVPFLGNIPLLGNIFSYESKSVIDTELIISIIPTVVMDNE